MTEAHAHAHAPQASLPAAHDHDAEAAVLGSCLISPDATSTAVERLQPGQFHRRDYRLIFESILRVYDRTQAVDSKLLTADMREHGTLEEAGGATALADLARNVPHAANVEHYAEIVEREGVRRSLVHAAEQIIRDTRAGETDARRMLDQAMGRLFEVAEERQSGETHDIRSLLQTIFDRIQVGDDGPAVTGLSSGLSDLDDLTTGWHAGEMIVLAARPSMGKTTLAVNWAIHSALDEKTPTLFFSLEMSAQQLVQNMLCSRAGVDSQRMRRGFLSRDDFDRIGDAITQFRDAPLYIDDTPALTVFEMRSKARRMARSRDIGVIMFDYLQLMSAPGSESRQEEIRMISQSLKALARELRIPVIALAQLNRNVEQREGHTPRMSDLRESGAVEQDSDVIMLLHRPDYYMKEEQKEAARQAGRFPPPAELILAKQRNGPTGVVRLTYVPQEMRFKRHAEEHIPGV